MKHIINYLGVLLAIVLIGTTFTACSEDDDNGSANVGLGIKTFFPMKVVTNQPITINGSGFDGATEIEFPGGAKITNFEIVSNDMIRVNTPAGIPADGGKIVVHTANDQAESKQQMKPGHTDVTGFSKQAGETADGGELIEVYGNDLEFIKSVELLDADSAWQKIDHKDFYRKGTNKVVFRVPQKNIYEGTFVGILQTYDERTIPMPELTYKPSADEGHWETVKTMIWENKGQLGEINWSSDYRFAPENNSTGEECYSVPQDVWEKMKESQFYVTIKGASPQIRVTSGWWSTTWTGDDIFPGNERLADNGDGTYTLTVDLAGDPLLDVLDAQHLLFTGSGYTVEEIFFAEDVWVDGPGEVEVKVPVWTNGGTLGEINWSSDYRFAPESNSTGEECYTVPQDVWEKMKSEPFFVTVKGANPQIRITTGWWSTNFTADDIMPGHELLADNGDGTWTLSVDLTNATDLLSLLDAQHLLFTGSGYTVEEIYFIEYVAGGGGTSAKEVVIWEGDGSAGAVSWNGTYRFANVENVTGEEIYAIPMDQWEVIKTKTFYLNLEGTDPQIRVTTGWWSTNLTADDIQPGNEMLTDNGDGTWTLELNLSGATELLELLDAQHLLFTGDRYTPLKLFYFE